MTAVVVAQTTSTENSFFLFDLFAGALNFFYTLVPSYGFTIIALTVVVMAVLTPLTFKGTRSMMVMQQMQPEIKKIQSRYKDDRQKQNEELLKFYKDNNINPMGGCLPLLVQMPIFFVLYAVLRGMTQRVPVTDVGWPSGQIGSGVPVTQAPLANFEPGYLRPSSELYQSLAQTNTMQFFGMDLAQSASDAMRVGVVHALPYFLLIAVVAVTGVVQQRQIQGRNPNQQVNPQQQMIMKVMPFFLPVISFGLPSGLVLYFVVSNLWRIGQQEIISRSIYGIKRGQKATAGSKTPGSKAKATAGAGRTSGAKAAGGREKKEAVAASGRSEKNGGGAKATTREVPKRGSRNTSQPASPQSKAGRSKTAQSKAAQSTTARSTTPPSPSTTNGGRGKRASSGGASDAAPTTPVLQPRARKNKKR